MASQHELDLSDVAEQGQAHGRQGGQPPPRSLQQPRALAPTSGMSSSVLQEAGRIPMDETAATRAAAQKRFDFMRFFRKSPAGSATSQQQPNQSTAPSQDKSKLDMFSFITMRNVAIAIVVLLVIFLISGGAASPSQPWLPNAHPGAAGYFAVGEAAAGVISCGSAFGIGVFSIGIVSISLLGGVGVFSIGIFSVGFFSVGVLSVGHFAVGVWAWGAISRWVKSGQGWSDGRPMTLAAKKADPRRTSARRSDASTAAAAAAAAHEQL